MVGRMSGDLFRGNGLTDSFSSLDNFRLQNMTNAGDTFAGTDPQYKLGQKSLRRQADWYGGPGGESATKIGLAALLALAGGSVLGAGGLGGEAAGAGGGEAAAGGGEAAGTSGMDFSQFGYDPGGEGMYHGSDYTGGTSLNQGTTGLNGGNSNWFKQAQMGQGMFNQSNGQQQQNPILSLLLQKAAQQQQQTTYTPLYPGALTQYMKG